ncbi:hypothetical protein CW751_10100 [Brumimicrobium salinarum]|uniref:Outer membrane protein beta-barrel domain-containing protein n=1 Tax=Brumimicrobium salinarum TaxID=2058658 RepID=A0A2I0R1F4_9FLAO|nr:hypothetical protein [Brumimicrobium salinarum]PKR80412.1 hypothetical protein CW751_10100 [Brumimicrobium salinarum]
MRNYILLLITFFVIGTASNLKAQVVKKDDIIIDTYYGFPNLYTVILKGAALNSGYEKDVTVKGIGPLGLRGEYMISDNIGLGLEIGFNNTNLSYKEDVEEYNSNTNEYYTKTYTYEYNTHKPGFMFSFNYHFLKGADNFDAYFVVAAGYAKRKISFKSNNPNSINDVGVGLFPIAAKIGVGARYFFTQNLGLNVALGLGQGGIINGGLSFKL